MKLREINETPEWTFWLPDFIADWDAPSHWERGRLKSMQALLKPDEVLVDVGTEHGWLTAVYGSFVGYDNLVLVEPSPELWPNIRLTWERNGFSRPLACYQTFCGNEDTGDYEVPNFWPECSIGPEMSGMAYRYLNQHDIPSVTIDRIQRDVTRSIGAISIDVEGAELLVLQGAGEVLRVRRPKVWVSIHPDLMERDFGHTRQELVDYMEDFDYVWKRLEIDHEEHWLFMPKEKV